MDRRFFLKSAGLAAALIFCREESAWSAYSRKTPSKELALYNAHTGEDLDVCYFSKGQYRTSALRHINYILRDHRTDEIKPIDRNLLDILSAIRKKLRLKEPFHVISGYRSPSTNAMLRRKSSRVAKNSLHCEAKAVDITIPGVPLRTLRQIAISLQRGGVGYYPRSNFIHVDTGPVRTW